ncbi:MAG TPA: rcc01693 family protein [Methylomirabilota bacterium]|nr:rcc01693 family protein [Methylomirabilota bacterium]
MIAYGLAVLKLPPDQFWSLTPRELAAMLGPSRPSPAPGRAHLAALMRAHPDIPAGG